MSLDLFKESGYHSQGVEENPWQQEQSRNSNTLETDGDTDFGEFEEANSEKPSAIAITEASEAQFLDLSDSQAADAANNRNPGGKSVLDPRTLEQESTEYQDDDWGDFVEETQEPRAEKHMPPIAELSGVSFDVELPKSGRVPDQILSIDRSPEPKPVQDILVKSSQPLSAKPKPNSRTVPPSNIPPPSILLALAARVIQQAPTEIKQMTASVGFLDSSSAESGKTINDKVQTHLSLFRAIAHILAGRKLRWKRDTHLAQSMKIAPSQAGKSGGMKLTGIDRMESRKEDQEAAEVMTAWRQHLGSLRAAIASASSQPPGHNMILPTIVENMLVRSANTGEGALTAPRCCVLCGLKREERVQKVDFNVEDSFGEWWTEHWGHVDCERFWEAHKTSLQQR